MKIVSSRQKYSCPIFTVNEEVAVDPDGFQIRRSIVVHPGSAVVLSVDEKGRILLVRQYRLPARAYMWELPAGKIDPGETPLRAARRELEEEAGLRASKWRKLASFFASPGYVSERMTIYVATDITPTSAKPMPDERIYTRWFAPNEIERMILTGRLVDAKTIIGFLLWQKISAAKRRASSQRTR